MTQEHAPSFTSFDDYRDWYDYTDIERVEFQAFFYGNIVGIARLMQLLGDKRYAELYELAAKIRQAVIASMWDKEDDFFYAVRESDGIKARCSLLYPSYPNVGKSAKESRLHMEWTNMAVYE
jgi:neutral trehalase